MKLCILQPSFKLFTNFRPICHLPGPQKPVCAVRCCPVLYEYQNKETKTLQKSLSKDRFNTYLEELYKADVDD